MAEKAHGKYVLYDAAPLLFMARFLLQSREHNVIVVLL